MRLDPYSQKAFIFGTYEPDVCAVIQRLVQPGLAVADIGAHIDYMTLLPASKCGVHHADTVVWQL